MQATRKAGLGNSRYVRACSQRRHSERLGRLAELAAAVLLLLKGYWIIGRRVRSAYGEIDLIAVRGRRLAMIEVKYRRSLSIAEQSVTHNQADRMATAAEQWMSRRAAYRDYSLSLDAIFIAPWHLPKHVVGALH